MSNIAPLDIGRSMSRSMYSFYGNGAIAVSNVQIITNKASSSQLLFKKNNKLNFTRNCETVCTCFCEPRLKAPFRSVASLILFFKRAADELLSRFIRQMQ